MSEIDPIVVHLDHPIQSAGEDVTEIRFTRPMTLGDLEDGQDRAEAEAEARGLPSASRVRTMRHVLALLTGIPAADLRKLRKGDADRVEAVLAGF